MLPNRYILSSLLLIVFSYTSSQVQNVGVSETDIYELLNDYLEHESDRYNKIHGSGKLGVNKCLFIPSRAYADFGGHHSILTLNDLDKPLLLDQLPKMDSANISNFLSEADLKFMQKQVDLNQIQCWKKTKIKSKIRLVSEEQMVPFDTNISISLPLFSLEKNFAVIRKDGDVDYLYKDENETWRLLARKAFSLN